MNYQHVFTVLAILFATSFFIVPMALVTTDASDKTIRLSFVFLFILTIITAALAAGMEK